MMKETERLWLSRAMLITGLLTMLLLANLADSHAADEEQSKKRGSASLRSPETVTSWNGPDALAAYRKMWNPLSAGPELIPMADTAPPGEFYIRPFFYGRVVQSQYNGAGGVQSLPSGFYRTQLLSLAEIGVGLNDNTQFTLFPSIISTWSSFNNVMRDGNGLSDLTMEIKYRFRIQHPDSALPSMAFAMHVTLPTSQWAGTPVIPGGMPPLARIPSTHFGVPGITPALLMRKIEKPFRLYADFFYTFDIPNNGSILGVQGSPLVQYGDLFQYRFGIENIVNDRHGLGYILEFVGMSGLPFSIDGLPVNGHGTLTGPFNVWGLQPTVEANLAQNIIISAGVLLPVAGINEYQSIAPNFSIYWYWGPHGGNAVAR
ncbi:MAG: hypothetical protein ACYCTV_11180 [Leptospirales bacterium]